MAINYMKMQKKDIWTKTGFFCFQSKKRVIHFFKSFDGYALAIMHTKAVARDISFWV